MSWISRLRNALRPARLDDEIAEEMRDHIERRATDLEAQGMGAEEARRQARLRFGNATRLQENSREFHLWTALEITLQDIRYAWRGMKKSPAFALTAVLSLSLAIGANTAIFSIVDAAILRQLPVREPGELIMLAWPGVEQPGDEPGQERESFSYPMYRRFRETAGTAARLALFGYPGQAETRIGDGGLEHATRQFLSGDGFEMLGITPAAGRLLSPDYDRTPGGHPVAVLSYDYWRRRFGKDPGAVGRTIEIGGSAYTIIGVTREGFFGVNPGKFVDFWLPAMMYDKQALTEPGWNWFRIVGRLEAGTTPAQLQARLQPPFHESMLDTVKRFTTMPESARNQLRAMNIRVHPAATGVSGFRRDYTRPLWIVLGVAAVILLIACANVASLLLARSTARSAEMAMRVSLGASRGRLMRQMLTESLLLSAAAGLLGWLMAQAAAPTLVNAISRDIDPIRFALATNTRMLLACVGISTLAAVLFGLAPAWLASGERPATALKSSATTRGRLRMGWAFVSVQVAFAFCLVMTGAAFLYSLRNLARVDTGFDPSGVAVLNVSTDGAQKPPAAQRITAFEMARRVASRAGVESVAIAPWPIFEGSGWSSQVILPGQPPSEREEVFYCVSPKYFQTMRTPILEGRDFRENDSGARAPAPAIVNRAFVERYLGEGNAIGREFSIPKGGDALARLRVVAVSANAFYGDLRKGPQPIVYLPLDEVREFTFYVRSALGIGPLARLVESETQAVGSGARLQHVTTLETLVGSTIIREKLLAGIGGAFGLLGVLLAAIGVFGLLSYSVARRTREIGIRAALGAPRRELMLLVGRELFGMTGAGVLAGIAGSLALMKALQSLLFGVKVADPLVMATAAVVFLAAALAAAGLPARRAAAVDPLTALRCE